MEGLTTAEDFWQDKDQAQEIYDSISAKKKRIATWQDLYQRGNDLDELVGLMHENGDEKEIKQLEKDCDVLNKDFGKAEVELLLIGEYDQMNAFLSIHSGTGGVDAQDWA
ncbi:PCRF domain-containing protein, partial [Patescibacteria group bacterium]|nr:PCRF domain-containing protein [Patescibacteria group bacterium]